MKKREDEVVKEPDFRRIEERKETEEKRSSRRTWLEKNRRTEGDGGEG